MQRTADTAGERNTLLMGLKRLHCLLFDADTLTLSSRLSIAIATKHRYVISHSNQKALSLPKGMTYVPLLIANIIVSCFVAFIMNTLSHVVYITIIKQNKQTGNSG